MTLIDILVIVATMAVITVVLWAIGRQGVDMGVVFGRLLTHGAPERLAPRGVQEDDDAWEHIREDRQRPPAGPVTEEGATRVPTVPARRSG